MVHNAFGTLKKVILCPPDNFTLVPINVIARGYMDKGEKGDLEICRREHAEFAQAYLENGVEVVMLEPRKGFPYQVFARDFGASVAGGVVLGRFSAKVRRGEEQDAKAVIASLNYPLLGTVEQGAFEGGDFWMLDESTLAVGSIARSSPEGIEALRRILEPHGYEVVMVRAEEKFLHLDMIFNIVAEKVAVAYIDALPDDFLKRVRSMNYELIELPEEDVFKLRCNLQALGRGRVLSFENNGAVNQALRSLGLEVIELNLTELLKGGGGPHCMTFPLERDKS